MLTSATDYTVYWEASEAQGGAVHPALSTPHSRLWQCVPGLAQALYHVRIQVHVHKHLCF